MTVRSQQRLRQVRLLELPGSGRWQPDVVLRVWCKRTRLGPHALLHELGALPHTLRPAVQHGLRVGLWASKASLLCLGSRLAGVAGCVNLTRQQSLLLLPTLILLPALILLPPLHALHGRLLQLLLLLRDTSGGGIGQLLAMWRVVMALHRVLRGQVCAGDERARSRGRDRVELVRGRRLARDMLLRRGRPVGNRLPALALWCGLLLVGRGDAVGLGVILTTAFVAVEDGIDAEGRCSTNWGQPYERRLAMRGIIGVGLFRLRLEVRVRLWLLLMLVLLVLLVRLLLMRLLLLLLLRRLLLLLLRRLLLLLMRLLL